jgi:hypothetical protein
MIMKRRDRKTLAVDASRGKRAGRDMPEGGRHRMKGFEEAMAGDGGSAAHRR